MKNQATLEENKTRVILYCRSEKGDNSELQEQKDVLNNYAKAN